MGRIRRSSLTAGLCLAAAVVVSTALTSSPVHAAAQGGTSGGACARPYTDGSPWNTPIGADPPLAPRGKTRAQVMGERLSSDPTQFTYPVYRVGRKTRRVTVRVTGTFSQVSRRGTQLRNRFDATVRIPLPRRAIPARGSDAQLIVVEPRTGREWGFFQFRRTSEGFVATNGYRYNTRWSGVAPQSGTSVFSARGAGIPYLAGLVRPCEIKRGRIDHALAYAYHAPTHEFVHPATKSDGVGSDPLDVPEGARLQLDPSLSQRQLRSRGCRGACLTIARALQRYGMIVVDNSGRPKVMMEFEGTARWRGLVSADTVAPLSLDLFRVLRY